MRQRFEREFSCSHSLKDLFLFDPVGTVDARAAPLRKEREPDPLPKVAGGFQTILADPPWRFTNRTGKVAPEHRRLDRCSTMSMDAIKALRVSKVAAKNAHLAKPMFLVKETPFPPAP